MADPPNFARLQLAHGLVPEFAERTDYDLRRAFDRALEQDLWVCTLADSAPAAFATAYERQGAFYLWLLGVRPDLRRNGLASSLFQCYLSEGERRGLTVFTVHTHSDAPGMVRLLEAAGFSQVSLGLEVVEIRGTSHAREKLAFTLRK